MTGTIRAAACTVAVSLAALASLAPALAEQARTAVLAPMPALFHSFAPGSGGPFQAVAFTPVPVPKPYQERGLASWYGMHWSARKTASGEPYEPKEMTAAHRSIPFGTLVKVTNLANRRSVIVRINDRGPYRRGRIIDLSYAAAASLGAKHRGVARVRLEVVAAPQPAEAKLASNE